MELKRISHLSGDYCNDESAESWRVICKDLDTGARLYCREVHHFKDGTVTYFPEEDNDGRYCFLSDEDEKLFYGDDADEDSDDLKDIVDVAGTMYGEKSKLIAFNESSNKFVLAGISFTPMYKGNEYIGLGVRLITSDNPVVSVVEK